MYLLTNKNWEVAQPCHRFRFRDRFFWISEKSPYHQTIISKPAITADQMFYIFAKSILQSPSLQNKRELFEVITIEEYIKHTTVDKLDRKEDYELILVDFGQYEHKDNEYLNDRHTHPYLKMVNPSTGEIHIEPVGHNTRTVKGALRFRAPGWAWPRFQRGWFAPKILT